ncbi:hypothetical protein LTS18_006133, partial [Coniosporium uncinatum]
MSLSNQNTHYVGQRLSYDGQLCTVRYIGIVSGTKGEWLGVEWDDPTRGKHNGQHGNVKYFDCLNKSATAGSFVRTNRPSNPPQSLVEALKQKYASDGDFATADVKVITGPVSDRIKISGKEVEEVGFEKIRRQLAELHELRIVLLDNLCIARPLPQSLRREWCDELDDDPRIPLDEEGVIKQTCPKVTELDLSCNLFEDWKEIGSVCKELPLLTSLRLDGNRFQKLEVYDKVRIELENMFRGIKFLGLEDTLMRWEDLCNIASLFNGLTTLSAANNALTQLSSANLPATLTSLILEGNAFRALSDVTGLSELPNLQKLHLKYNTIFAAARPGFGNLPSLSRNLTELDLSYNSLDSWALIHALPQMFPGLVSLRVSHNPLYQNLKAPDGKSMTADDGYMLTIARLPM